METAEAKRPSLGDVLSMELGLEMETLKKMVERLPDDKYDWQPHEKSMTLGRLTNHCIDMVKWTNSIIDSDRLDFGAQEYVEAKHETTAEALEAIDVNTAAAQSALAGVSDSDLMGNWTLCDGDNVFFTMPRVAVIRSFVMSHVIHHRGQLSVYMRLLDIPVPSIYGPSADEPM